MPSRILMNCFLRSLCFSESLRLIEMPEVWVNPFPAHAKDRKLTSREGADFASSRNKLEGEKPNEEA